MRDQVIFCIKTIRRPQSCAAHVRSIYEHDDNDHRHRSFDDSAEPVHLGSTKSFASKTVTAVPVSFTRSPATKQ